MNPDVGKPSTLKQALKPLAGKFVNVRFVVALLPTLITKDDGLTFKVGSSCVVAAITPVKVLAVTKANSNVPSTVRHALFMFFTESAI